MIYKLLSASNRVPCLADDYAGQCGGATGNRSDHEMWLKLFRRSIMENAIGQFRGNNENHLLRKQNHA